LIAHDADRTTIETGKATHDRTGPVGEVFEEVAVVDDDLDELLHVVGNVRCFGHQLVELFATPLGVVAEGAARWLFEVVGRQERQQILDIVDTGFLVLGYERRHTRFARMTAGAAQLFETHFFAGHRS
jgi:hypothetical protein